MNDDIIATASRKIGEVPFEEFNIAQWSTESSRLMVSNSLTGCRTGWIRMQDRGRTSKYLNC